MAFRSQAWCALLAVAVIVPSSLVLSLRLDDELEKSSAGPATSDGEDNGDGSFLVTASARAAARAEAAELLSEDPQTAPTTPSGAQQVLEAFTKSVQSVQQKQQALAKQTQKEQSKLQEEGKRAKQAQNGHKEKLQKAQRAAQQLEDQKQAAKQNIKAERRTLGKAQSDGKQLEDAKQQIAPYQTKEALNLADELNAQEKQLKEMTQSAKQRQKTEKDTLKDVENSAKQLEEIKKKAMTDQQAQREKLDEIKLEEKQLAENVQKEEKQLEDSKQKAMQKKKAEEQKLEEVQSEEKRLAGQVGSITTVTTTTNTDKNAAMQEKMEEMMQMMKNNTITTTTSTTDIFARTKYLEEKVAKNDEQEKAIEAQRLKGYVEDKVTQMEESVIKASVDQERLGDELERKQEDAENKKAKLVEKEKDLENQLSQTGNKLAMRKVEHNLLDVLLKQKESGEEKRRVLERRISGIESKLGNLTKTYGSSSLASLTQMPQHVADIASRLKSEGIAQYDRDGTNDLNAEEFRRLARDVSPARRLAVSDGDMERLVAKYDLNNNGALDVSEAIDFVMKAGLPATQLKVKQQQEKDMARSSRSRNETSSDPSPQLASISASVDDLQAYAQDEIKKLNASLSEVRSGEAITSLREARLEEQRGQRAERVRMAKQKVEAVSREISEAAAAAEAGEASTE